MKVIAAVGVIAASVPVVQGFGTLCGSNGAEPQANFPSPTEMPQNLKMVWLGDQGLGSNPIEVMQMIKDFGADFVIHAGDFDYIDNPTRWLNQIDDVLGPNYPYFASIGNHDVRAWTGSNGYQNLLEARGRRWGQDNYCTGDMSVNQACYYKGLYFVLSGVGTRGSGHVSYIDQAFRHHMGPEHPWKLCSWHKDQRLMQIGGKPDETGWAVYDMCRVHGAIINTAHEHSFCRSYLMRDVERQNIVNTNNDITLTEGESFVHVTGVGGKSLRPTRNNLHRNPWWAAWGATDNNLRYGAMFCTFYIDNDPHKAKCDFPTQTTNFDSFYLYSNLTGRVNEEDRESVLSRKCRSKFHDLAVTRSEDDVFYATGASVASTALKKHDQEGTTVFTFRNLPVDEAALELLDDARLQVMGAATATKRDVSMTLRVVPVEAGETVTLQSLSARGPVVAWTVPEEEEAAEDEFERHEVWVSPNIGALVRNALARTETRDVAVMLTVSGDAADRAFYTIDDSECLAPSLTLTIAPDC